jgi:phospholipid/cholesterol/gamma-HCH transport system ATP-binding protein
MSSPSTLANGIAPQRQNRDIVIGVRDLVVGFGDRTIIKGLNLDVFRGEVLGVVGGSGQGKSVLTRAILGLVPTRGGAIRIFGQDRDALAPAERRTLEQRWGVLFQNGALFSGLTVKQNIQMPMRETRELSRHLMDELAMLKLELVGLSPDAADKFPSELSGGMVKRAALARALALDPELVFLDEPTSGLDPISAAEFDELIGTLQQTLGLTVFMVTHDLDSLYSICDRVAALAEGRVIAAGPLETLLESDHPWLRAYFHGVRGGRLTAARIEHKDEEWKPAPTTP